MNQPGSLYVLGDDHWELLFDLRLAEGKPWPGKAHTAATHEHFLVMQGQAADSTYRARKTGPGLGHVGRSMQTKKVDGIGSDGDDGEPNQSALSNRYGRDNHDWR